MVDAIVYNSNTGFTKQYAYALAVSTHLPVYSLTEASQLGDHTNIIFMSWVKDGKITSLPRVKRFNVVCVCAIGMFPYSEELVDHLKKDNSIESLFYLRGGLRYYKLNMVERAVISDLRKKYQKKSKKEQMTFDEIEILAMLNNGREKIDLDTLEPLIDWIESEKESIVC